MNRQARLRPAVAAERDGPLVRQVLHEERAAPGLALEPDAEVCRLVGILGADAGLADDGLEALEVGDHLADVGEVDARERLRIQELPARAPLDAEGAAPVRRQRQARAVLDFPHVVDAVVVGQRERGRLRHLRVVVAERRVDLPGVVDHERELGLDARDLGGRQVDVAELEHAGLRVLDLDREVVPVHQVGRDVEAQPVVHPLGLGANLHIGQRVRARTRSAVSN